MTGAADLEITLDEETKKNVTQWLEGCYDEEVKFEIRKLLKENRRELVDAFYKNLSFGTGGLRGVMGVGTNRINIYTVGMMTQGLANYLKKQPIEQKSHSVLIGYDSRHHSRTFAEEAAKILLGNGLKVFLFKEIRPTPLVSFGCRLKKCSAALMFTASHNPPEYNGCKIYWNDGAQVAAPNDSNIIAEVNAIQDINSIQHIKDLNDPQMEWIENEIDEIYYEAISHLQNYREDNQCYGNELQIVYTSLHGTGITLTPLTLARWGFQALHLIEEQVVPDGDFPTVSSPNPEEPSVLALGIAKLKNTNGDLLIAHDPDADRVAVVVKHKSEVRFISGNQIAALLLDHICKAMASRNKIAANGAFIKTIVTTELFAAIADYYQKPCFNVLPSFKYIAEKIRQWENDPQGRQYIFGGEESYGYLQGTYVRDKDAIAVSALICEMALQAKLQNKTLIDLLHALYQHYGIYEELVEVIAFPETKEGREKIAKLMELLQRRPPKKILGHRVVSLEDYRRSIKTDFTKQQTESLLLPKADILLFWLDDKSKLVIRPSGTEPKIKIYCGVVKKEFVSIEKGIEECQGYIKELVESLLTIMKEDYDFLLA